MTRYQFNQRQTVRGGDFWTPGKLAEVVFRTLPQVNYFRMPRLTSGLRAEVKTDVGTFTVYC